MSDFTLDTRQFQRALQEYADATKKDEADILNKAGKDVVYRAAQFTPKAKGPQIKAFLLANPKLLYALTARMLKKKGIGALKSPQFQEATQQLIRKRASSARYLTAAWARAAEAFGATFRGAKFKGATGYGIKATPANLLATIVAIVDEPDDTHARSAEAVEIVALQEALDFKARDMIEYAQRKLAKTAAKHSA